MYTKVMDLTQAQLVSITDFRRNAGAYIRMAKPLRIIKDSREIGTYTPSFSTSSLTAYERVKKVQELAGKLNLGIGLTADQMNEDYDKMYDEMLPR